MAGLSTCLRSGLGGIAVAGVGCTLRIRTYDALGRAHPPHQTEAREGKPESLRPKPETGNRDGPDATADRWGKAMDVMCNHVGEFISSAQLAAEAGMPINHWRDAPRKLPSHLAKHYEHNIEWPLKAVGGRDLKKDDQVY
jgi:hypothetical protein